MNNSKSLQDELFNRSYRLPMEGDTKNHTGEKNTQAQFASDHQRFTLFGKIRMSVADAAA